MCGRQSVCVSLVAVQDWCQIQRLVWHCLVKQSMCVLRLGTCAGFLIKYAVGVNAAAEMPNRENQGEKRELEKDSRIRHTTLSLPSPALSSFYPCTCQLRLFTLFYLSLLLFYISSLSISTPPTKFLRSYPHSYPQPFISLTLSFPLK